MGNHGYPIRNTVMFTNVTKCLPYMKKKKKWMLLYVGVYVLASLT